MPMFYDDKPIQNTLFIFHSFGLIDLSRKTSKRFLEQYSWKETEFRSDKFYFLLDEKNQCLTSEDFSREHCPKGKSGSFYFLPLQKRIYFDLRSPYPYNNEVECYSPFLPSDHSPHK